MPTKIEWTEETWNPIVGCRKCSPGCENCYAERMARRLAGIEIAQESDGRKYKYRGVVSDGGWNGRIVVDFKLFDNEKAFNPFLLKKPSKIFVVSMGDLFFEGIKFSYINDIIEIQRQAPQHKYILLTKRPGRALKFQKLYGAFDKNIWIGVTVCNQDEANEKIGLLKKCDASIKFLSIEPILGEIDLKMNHRGRPLISGIDWVIVGGENGPGARPLNPEWVESLKNQCADFGVPFFFKSWGQYKYFKSQIPAGERNSIGEYNSIRVGKNVSGHLIDGKEYREYPREKTL